MSILFPTLIAAAVSGLAYIAYENPEGYANLSNYMIIVVALVLFITQIWNWAANFTYWKLRRHHNHTEESKEDLDSATAPNVVGNGLLLLLIYLFFLRYLHDLLGSSQ